MKTLQTKTITGIEIITGISKLSICGVETNKNCEPMIDALPESEQMRRKADDGIAKLTQAAIEKRKAKEFAKNGEQSASLKHATKAEKLYHAADVINDELKELKKVLVPKQYDIKRNNPHFHEPGRGLLQKLDGETWPEYLARIQPLEDQFLARNANEQVKTDGNVIPDFRGSKYSKKIGDEWGFGTIIAVGVTIPTGAIRDEDLTEAQKAEIADQNENGRMAGLSAEERAIEKDMAIDSALGQSINMRSGLEISGDPDALIKAQDWYNSEVLKINDKYGV